MAPARGERPLNGAELVVASAGSQLKPRLGQGGLHLLNPIAAALRRLPPPSQLCCCGVELVAQPGVRPQPIYLHNSTGASACSSRQSRRLSSEWAALDSAGPMQPVSVHGASNVLRLPPQHSSSDCLAMASFAGSREEVVDLTDSPTSSASRRRPGEQLVGRPHHD